MTNYIANSHGVTATYTNPRNHRSELIACSVCGITQDMLRLVPCKPERGNLMDKQGWVKFSNVLELRGEA